MKTFIACTSRLGNPVPHSCRIAVIQVGNDGINFPSEEFFVLKVRFVDDTDGVVVIDFLKRNVLFQHFSINRADRFRPSFNLKIEFFFFQFFRNMFYELLNIALAMFFGYDEFFRNLVVDFGHVVF